MAKLLGTDTGDGEGLDNQGLHVDETQREEGAVVDPEEPEQDEADEEGFVKVKQDVLNKRIGKEVGKRKEAEEKAQRAQAEADVLKKRFDGDNSRMMLDIAKKHGVLPELLSKEDAAGLSQLEDANANVDVLDSLLDDEKAEEFTIDGKQFSRKEVRGMLRDWRTKRQQLSDRYGDVSRTAAKTMQEVIALGMKAKAAGWTGEKKPPAQEPDDDKREKKSVTLKTTRQPGDEPPPRAAEKTVSVSDRKGLAAFMATQK